MDVMSYFAPDEDIGQSEIICYRRGLAHFSHVQDTFVAETLF